MALETAIFSLSPVSLRYLLLVSPLSRISRIHRVSLPFFSGATGNQEELFFWGMRKSRSPESFIFLRNYSNEQVLRSIIELKYLLEVTFNWDKFLYKTTKAQRHIGGVTEAPPIASGSASLLITISPPRFPRKERFYCRYLPHVRPPKKRKNANIPDSRFGSSFFRSCCGGRGILGRFPSESRSVHRLEKSTRLPFSFFGRFSSSVSPLWARFGRR